MESFTLPSKITCRPGSASILTSLSSGMSIAPVQAVRGSLASAAVAGYGSNLSVLTDILFLLFVGGTEFQFRPLAFRTSGCHIGAVVNVTHVADAAVCRFASAFSDTTDTDVGVRF